MKIEIVDTPILDPNYDSYVQFFDYDWAREFGKRAENSALQQAAIDFVLACRYASEAHRLPWLSVELLRNYADGEKRGALAFRAQYAELLIQTIIQKLGAKMDRHFTRDTRKALTRAIKELEKEFLHKMQNAAQLKFNSAAYWDYMTNPKRDPTGIIPMSVFGIQRNNYLALYFAYEDLSLHVIRTKKPTFKANPPKVTIGGTLDTLFGTLGKDCWDDEVNLARLVRNQLVHSGGRFDPKLGTKYPGRFVDQKTSPLAPIRKGELFMVVNNKIQITPSNGRHLFNVLKDRAMKMIDKTA
jgi:hypothetical protein